MWSLDLKHLLHKYVRNWLFLNIYIVHTSAIFSKKFFEKNYTSQCNRGVKEWSSPTHPLCWEKVMPLRPYQEVLWPRVFACCRTHQAVGYTQWIHEKKLGDNLFPLRCLYHTLHVFHGILSFLSLLLPSLCSRERDLGGGGMCSRLFPNPLIWCISKLSWWLSSSLQEKRAWRN